MIQNIRTSCFLTYCVFLLAQLLITISVKNNLFEVIIGTPLPTYIESRMVVIGIFCSPGIIYQYSVPVVVYFYIWASLDFFADNFWVANPQCGRVLILYILVLYLDNPYEKKSPYFSSIFCLKRDCLDLLSHWFYTCTLLILKILLSWGKCMPPPPPPFPVFDQSIDFSYQFLCFHGFVNDRPFFFGAVYCSNNISEY